MGLLCNLPSFKTKTKETADRLGDGSEVRHNAKGLNSGSPAPSNKLDGEVHCMAATLALGVRCREVSSCRLLSRAPETDVYQKITWRTTEDNIFR